MGCGLRLSVVGVLALWDIHWAVACVAFWVGMIDAVMVMICCAVCCYGVRGKGYRIYRMFSMQLRVHNCALSISSYLFVLLSH